MGNPVLHNETSEVPFLMNFQEVDVNVVGTTDSYDVNLQCGSAALGDIITTTSGTSTPGDSDSDTD